MAIAFAIFGIAFAAFCVWLTVRIVNRRERWAKWTLTAVVCVPALYVLSFGPACWLCYSGYISSKAIVNAYDPVFTLYRTGPKTIRTAIIWYSDPLGKEGPLDAPTVIGLDAMGIVYVPDR